MSISNILLFWENKKEKLIDNFIEIEDYDSLTTVFNSGYRPSKKQLSKLIYNLNCYNENDNNNDNKKLQKIINHIIDNDSNLIKSLNIELQQVLSTPVRNKKILFTTFNQSYDFKISEHSFVCLNYIKNNKPELINLQIIPNNNFFNNMAVLKKIDKEINIAKINTRIYVNERSLFSSKDIQDFLDLMTHYLNSQYEKQKEIALRPFSYEQNIKQKAISIASEKLKTEYEISLHDNKIINDIIKSSEYLDKFDFEDKENFKKLLNEKIPKIISHYISIPQNQRSDFRNSKGKNANDLFTEALNEISIIFKSKIKSLEESHLNSKLSDLSVDNRYLDAFKKNNI